MVALFLFMSYIFLYIDCIMHSVFKAPLEEMICQKQYGQNGYGVQHHGLSIYFLAAAILLFSFWAAVNCGRRKPRLGRYRIWHVVSS